MTFVLVEELFCYLEPRCFRGGRYKMDSTYCIAGEKLS